MRQGQQNRRGRGRSNSNSNSNSSNHNNGRKQQNSLSRNYESNGPDVKIRGSATQIAEKYMTLARDASSAGDIVMAENYLQHAEHYNRIIMAAQSQNQSQSQAQTQAQPQIQQPANEQDEANAPAQQDRRTPAETSAATTEQPQPEVSPANAVEQPDVVPVAAEKDQPAPSDEGEAAQPVRRRRRRYPGSASSRANASGVENANGHANGADITPSEAQPSTEAVV
jgi:hypothetical protein